MTNWKRSVARSWLGFLAGTTGALIVTINIIGWPVVAIAEGVAAAIALTIWSLDHVDGGAP